MPVRTRIDVAKEVAPKFGVTLQEADRFVLLVLNEIKAMRATPHGDDTRLFTVIITGVGRRSPTFRRKEISPL